MKKLKQVSIYPISQINKMITKISMLGLHYYYIRLLNKFAKINENNFFLKFF